MTSQNDRIAAFFGRMTADLTHEIKNILAIIQESAGLMEDITAISPPAEKRFQEKFNNALRAIRAQLQRGMELTTLFNRFAHIPDSSRAEIDLVDAVRNMHDLAGRFARMKCVELAAVNIGADPVRLEANPVGVYLAIFSGIDCCLSVLPAQTSIALVPAHRNGKPAVGFQCKGDPLPDTPVIFSGKLQQVPAWAEMALTMEQLGGMIEPEIEIPGFWLIFN